MYDINMKVMRLWFVAVMVALILRDKPLFTVEEYKQPPSISMWIDLQAFEVPEMPAMPEQQEWFSFLDQETGTWKKELR